MSKSFSVASVPAAHLVYREARGSPKRAVVRTSAARKPQSRRSVCPTLLRHRLEARLNRSATTRRRRRTAALALPETAATGARHQRREQASFRSHRANRVPIMPVPPHWIPESLPACAGRARPDEESGDNRAGRWGQGRIAARGFTALRQPLLKFRKTGSAK